jgi:hypothetical protein
VGDTARDQEDGDADEKQHVGVAAITIGAAQS